MNTKHPWGARLAVALIMLTLAFLGMVIMDVKSNGDFDYWKWITPIYASLALWLSWYVKKKTKSLRLITIWHELLHWFGLLSTFFIVSFFVHLGIISRFIAGLFDLTLLSLCVFLAGIYIESTFFIVGIVLGLFTILAATLTEYLYAFVIPILIAACIITVITLWLSHKKQCPHTNNRSNS